VIFGVLLIAAVVLVGALIWIRFGKESGLAFSNILNSFTAFCLLLVTTAYVLVTAKILDTSAHNVRQQAELSEMMKKDLRVRITPSLRWRSLSGTTSALPCVVVNEGPGIAINVRGTLKYSSQIVNDLHLPNAIAVNHEQKLSINANNVQEIELSCDDSLNIAKYRWRYGFNGDLISYDAIPQ
jgi:hypothetical protein